MTRPRARRVVLLLAAALAGAASGSVPSPQPLSPEGRGACCSPLSSRGRGACWYPLAPRGRGVGGEGTAGARSADKDAAGARAAFRDVYKVLMHPRCLNCHPSGDAPLQGDDSHVHLQNVKRGEDGKGKYALKCASCHQDANLPGANMPPGNPTWQLPRKDMPLVFQGKSPRELADQLKDPRRNGGRTLEQLVEHVTHDKLVRWGWEPGDGRTKPPLSHDEFAKKFRAWVDKGAASPE